jgi:RNA polymerase sigma factor for flagellar operon FliA
MNRMPYKKYQKSMTSDELVRYFLPRIKAIAISLKSSLPENVEVDDLIQEGLIGLLNVRERYDDSKGAAFFTFAMKRVRGAMYDYLRKIDWIPRNTRHLMKKVENGIIELQNIDGQYPDEEKLMSHLNLTRKEVTLALKEMSRRQLLNLDGFLADSGSKGDSDSEDFTEVFSSDAKSPEEVYYKEELEEQLKVEISQLKERENMILSLYYVEELNFKEIAMILGVTESRISQIHRSIMIKLKSKMNTFLGKDE